MPFKPGDDSYFDAPSPCKACVGAGKVSILYHDTHNINRCDLQRCMVRNAQNRKRAVHTACLECHSTHKVCEITQTPWKKRKRAKERRWSTIKRAESEYDDENADYQPSPRPRKHPKKTVTFKLPASSDEEIDELDVSSNTTKLAADTDADRLQMLGQTPGAGPSNEPLRIPRVCTSHCISLHFELRYLSSPLT